MNNYLSDEDYDFIYSRVPRVCVDLLIKNSKGEVLLTKRDIEPYKDHWHFPGGRIKFKESIQSAIKRILKGELGLEDVKYEFVGYCEFPEEIQKGQERHSISIVHLVYLDTDNIKLDFSAKEWKFFSEMPSPVIPPQQEFLTRYKYL